METVRASISESKGLLNKNLGLKFGFETALTGMHQTYIDDFVGFQSLYKVTLPSGQVALLSEEVNKFCSAPSCRLKPF